jgi:hypothetical protein
VVGAGAGQSGTFQAACNGAMYFATSALASSDKQSRRLLHAAGVKEQLHQNKQRDVHLLKGMPGRSGTVVKQHRTAKLASDSGLYTFP